MAMWLASDHVDFRGEAAIANGWRQRARRLLAGLDPAPEHGWLAILEGDAALLMDDDTAAARRAAQQAAELGRRLGVADLEVLGLAMEGIALVSEGEVAEGMARLDEASVAALAGDLREIFSVTWALCYLIYACERVRDYDRAAQWCQKMKEFATRFQFRFVVGICRAHYGGVLIQRGAWDEADAELASATDDLTASRPATAAEGIVRLAELRRRQGRLEEAATLFGQAEGHPLALLGLAELALDQGNPQEAKDRLDQLLRRVPPENKTQRAAALELLVRVHVALGDHGRAAETFNTLQSICAAVATQPLQAAASFSGGIVAAAGGDYEEARRRFEDAVHLFERSGAPYETARARMELAGVLSALGRSAPAEHVSPVFKNGVNERSYGLRLVAY